jgi:hypothetical protein
LLELGFDMGEDDADGADDCAPAFSGADWLAVVAMWTMRVLARPSFVKVISMQQRLSLFQIERIGDDVSKIGGRWRIRDRAEAKRS